MEERSRSLCEPENRLSGFRPDANEGASLGRRADDCEKDEDAEDAAVVSCWLLLPPPPPLEMLNWSAAKPSPPGLVERLGE
jgi:hypothetical protein